MCYNSQNVYVLLTIKSIIVGYKHIIISIDITSFRVTPMKPIQCDKPNVTYFRETRSVLDLPWVRQTLVKFKWFSPFNRYHRYVYCEGFNKAQKYWKLKVTSPCLITNYVIVVKVKMTQMMRVSYWFGSYLRCTFVDRISLYAIQGTGDPLYRVTSGFMYLFQRKS